MENRYKLALFLLIIALLATSLGAMGISSVAQEPSALPQGQGPWVVRAYYTDRQLVDDLAAWLEPWEVHHDKGYLVVAVGPAEYQRLLDMGFHLEIDGELTAELNRPHVMLPNQTTGLPGYPCYRTVEETFAAAQAIAAAHPDLATWIDAGDSWEKTEPGGSAGYDMMVLRLTNSAVSIAKPKLFVMTSVHAREYTPAELNTRFAEYLVDNYGLDPDVTWLLDYTEIHLLLQANPDGRKHAEAGLLWRKNTNENYCSPTSNYRGADLNRNFGFQWGCCGGSSGSQCSETYRGPSAASEPETQAIQDYVRAEFPDQRGPSLSDPAPDDAMGIFLDIHSYSQLVLWPWGFTSSVAPNGAALQTLGRKFAHFNGYEPDQAIGLYPTDGTTDDFAYGELGLAAYTFELGTSFFQGCGAFENTILPDNLPALIYAAKTSRTPYLTPAGPDALDVAVAPGGVVSGTQVHLAATLDDTRYNNQNGSEPTQNIAAAEYYVDAPPWDTASTPVSRTMTVVDGSFDAKIEGVEATLDTSGLSNGRHIVFVRGQDAAGNWGPFSAAFLYILEPGVSPVIEGYVREGGTNAPLTATVTANTFQIQTDPATGYYSLTVISGTYEVSAVAADHAAASVSGLQAHDHQTIQQDLSLWPICEVLADDVEAGNPGWSAQSPWAITSEAAHSPTHSWTESPGGNYGNSRNVSLTSPPWDLSGSQGTTLSFWHIYDLETNWDYGYVEYSTNGGSTWTQAAAYTGYNHTAWTREEIPLPALDGQAQARIRFRFYSDTNTVADGWHIDDVVLSSGGVVCGASTAPTAAFTSNSPVMLGEPLTFTNQTIGSEPLAYLWDFGDHMSVSTVTNPVYTYLSAGTFTVTLTATNSVGSHSASQPIIVALPAYYLYLPLVTKNQ